MVLEERTIRDSSCEGSGYWEWEQEEGKAFGGVSSTPASPCHKLLPVDFRD